jgi:radical SAM protein (TIGR01212 family)
MRRFNSYKQFLYERFGSRIQKLTINAGFSCPNRDGKVGYGGCTYCLNDAFNPSYCDSQKTVLQQIEEGIQFHKNRYRRADGYLAYFQAFSNTYSPLVSLKEIYQPAIEHPLIKGILIGTRPDCIDDEKLDYFVELQKKLFVSIELGIESIHDETLLKINRGHDFTCTINALDLLKSKNIHTGAHFIFGLPGENIPLWFNDLKIINQLPLNSIKFHQLQIIKGTKMEEDYFQNKEQYHLFNMESYIDFIVSYTERLNPNFIIERFAGEVPPRYLAIDNWGIIRYDVVLQKIEKELERRKTWQGAHYRL